MESINVIQPVRVGEPQSVKDASDAEDQPEDHIPMFAVEEKVSLKVWASETICASTSCTTPASPRPRLSGCAQVLPDDPTSTGTIKRGGTFASFSNSLSRFGSVDFARAIMLRNEENVTRDNRPRNVFVQIWVLLKYQLANDLAEQMTIYRLSETLGIGLCAGYM